MQPTVRDASPTNDASHSLDVGYGYVCHDGCSDVFPDLSFSSSSIPVAFTTLSGEFLYTNSAFYKAMVVIDDKNGLRPFRMHDFFESAELAHELFKNVAERGLCRDKLVLVGRDGIKSKYRVSAKLINGISASVDWQVAFSFTAISEPCYADNFAKARLFRNKIVDAIADPLLVKDRNYRYVLMNEAFCRFMGEERAELLGKTNHDLFPESQAEYFNETDDQVFVTGQETVIEERVSSPSGTERIFVAKKTRYEDEWGDRFIVCIFRDVTEQRHAERVLAEKQKKLASMAIELSLAEERERMRVASELHDNIGQALILSRIKLAMLEQSEPGDEYEHTLKLAGDLLDDVIQRVRSLTVQISPPLLSGAGLETALSHLVCQIGKDYGLRVTFTDDRSCKPLSNELRSVVYQAARELLINVVKHANTDAAELVVWRESDELWLRVKDGGQGFDADDAALCVFEDSSCSFGMFNIRQRLKFFGGSLCIMSSPGNGTVATMRVPLDQSCKPCMQTLEVL